jgi:uncharacterized protein (DUF1697 family)
MLVTYIALFRGINVLGRNLLPMKALKILCEKNGCVDVQTYIQSGNVIFRSERSDVSGIAKQLSGSVSKSHGFEPRVVVITLAEIEKATAGNPFPEADKDPKSLHVFFLAEAPKRPDLTSFESLKTPTERFELKGKTFYLHTPDGFGRSKLAARAEKLLGVDATARNWRTVTTLVEIAKNLA